MNGVFVAFCKKKSVTKILIGLKILLSVIEIFIRRYDFQFPRYREWKFLIVFDSVSRINAVSRKI